MLLMIFFREIDRQNYLALGPWLMADGSRLMAHGSRLMAQRVAEQPRHVLR